MPLTTINICRKKIGSNNYIYAAFQVNTVQFYFWGDKIWGGDMIIKGQVIAMPLPLQWATLRIGLATNLSCSYFLLICARLGGVIKETVGWIDGK